jgi:hypothetical protein
VVAVDHVSVRVDLDEVGDPDVAEVHGEGVDPECLGVLGVPRGDVPGHALFEAETREQAQGGGQPLLAEQALGGQILIGAAVGRGSEQFGHGTSSKAPVGPA